MKFYLLSISSTVMLAPLSHAWPATSEQVSRGANCAGGSAAPYDEFCWSSLGLSGWLKEWNATAPRCGSFDDGTKCCGPNKNTNESWSTCFLRLALGDSDFDCTQINEKSCSLEGFRLSASANSSNAPQLRYVVRNIYGMSLHKSRLRYTCALLTLTSLPQPSTTSSTHGTPQPSSPPLAPPSPSTPSSPKSTPSNKPTSSSQTSSPPSPSASPSSQN